MKTILLKKWVVYSFEDGSVLDAFVAESKARLLARRLSDEAGLEVAYVRFKCNPTHAALDPADMPPDRS
jgi:hypothetical protein